jgi:sigma-54 specific flagellar transcriptional regulator A
VAYNGRVGGGRIGQPGETRLATRQIQSAAENAGFSARLPSGDSPAIQDVCRLIRKVAAHESSVLVLGESGTGKEVVARAVHDSGPRRGSPFVAVNCGAIPAELLESELFGHEKGAFTGAYTARRGRFEVAEGGTLFLDEIGDMSLPMQVKLLRVLQERVFERVGNHTPIRCNVRIIAATHRNLEDAISRGQFRGDLFYRLNVFPIEMPSLRERIDDLPVLISEFARQNVAAGRPLLRLSNRALQALKAYSWPGNVRELGNLIERLSVLNGDQAVDVLDLPTRYRAGFLDEHALSQLLVDMSEPLPDPDAPTAQVFASSELEAEEAGPRLDDAAAADGQAGEPTAVTKADDAAEPAGSSRDALPEDGLDLKAHLYAIEQQLISEALARSGGTVSQAARLLGLRRTTLVEKMRRFGMSVTDSAD